MIAESVAGVVDGDGCAVMAWESEVVVGPVVTTEDAVGSLGAGVVDTVDSVTLETIDDGASPQAASNPATTNRTRT